MNIGVFTHTYIITLVLGVKTVQKLFSRLRSIANSSMAAV